MVVLQVQRLGGGSSYPDSVSFCAFREKTLCPYEAYCSEITGKLAIFDNDGTVVNANPTMGPSLEQWSAVSDEVNGWVQVGPYNWCSAYSDMFADPPEWGMDGTGTKCITQNVLCCRSRDGAAGVEGPPQAEKVDAPSYEEVMSRYNPRIFDRGRGWEGARPTECYSSICIEAYFYSS